MSVLSTKQRLVKRLDVYYKLEGFNAIWIFGVSLYVLFNYGWKDTIWFTFGIWFMVYVLVQGTWYWKLKMHVLEGKKITQKQEILRFERFKKYNSILICCIPIALAIQYYVATDFWENEILLYFAIFVNAFAVLEHINYYYYQLMYDNPFDWSYLWRNKRLKPASLKKDLQERRI